MKQTILILAIQSESFKSKMNHQLSSLLYSEYISSGKDVMKLKSRSQLPYILLVFELTCSKVCSVKSITCKG